MNTMQIIAELGGVGAVANLAGGVISNALNGYRQAILDQRAFSKEATGIENKDAVFKREHIDKSDFAKVIVRFIVVVAFAVISAPVWAPMLTLFLHMVYTLTGHAADAPTIEVVWYYSKEGSFWLWDWTKLKEFRFGSEDATVTIGILPIFFAISTNIVSFYLLNRVRKRIA